MPAPKSIPQLNAVSAALARQERRAQQEFDRLHASKRLREHMFKQMDLTRFHACFDIGQPLNLKRNLNTLDDFVFMAAAERHQYGTEFHRLYQFMQAARICIDRDNDQRALSVQDADFIHKACDAAREALPNYSVEAIEQGSLTLNEVRVKRNNGTGYALPSGRAPTRNILQLRPVAL